MKRSINAAIDQDVLESNVIAETENKFTYNKFIFRQTFAPQHTAKSTKESFREKMMPVLDWSANNTDANQFKIYGESSREE